MAFELYLKYYCNRLITRGRHLEPSCKRLAERIAEVLVADVPRAFQTHRPKNEPHLQEVCDALLHTAQVRLDREFPYMRWSLSSTKPDWASLECDLWVELKYVRTRADIRRTTGAIAEDIVKYGDNCKNVLFVVYDPSHAIVAESAFAKPIRSRKGMVVKFIR